MRRLTDGLPGAVNVLFVGARQSRHLRFPDFPGDLTDGVKIALRGDGKPRLNDIDAEFFQLPGQKQLFLRVHAVARRLFSIPEGCVKNIDVIFILFHTLLLSLSKIKDSSLS